MLNSNEILVKDIEFNEIENAELVEIIKNYKKEYKNNKMKKNMIIFIEILILIIFTVLDFYNINVFLLLVVLSVIMLVQYLKWGFAKITAVSGHYDMTSFFKSLDDELVYVKVKCDDIAKEKNGNYIVLVSTLDNLNVMEKIRMPFIDKMQTIFDRNNENDKPEVYLIKSNITYFVVESMDVDWWGKNIQKIIK